MSKVNFRSKLILSILSLIILSILFFRVNKQWDLTEDQRYTLHPKVNELIRNSAENINITVFLEGNIPASFRNFKSYIDYYVSELARKNFNVAITFKNPTEGSLQETQALRSFLREQGIEPLRRQVRSQEELSESLLYPFISINNSEKLVFVNLLERDLQSDGEAGDLITTQLAFEQKFIKGLRSLLMKNSINVAVTGHLSELVSEGLNRDGNLGIYTFISSTGKDLLSSIDSIHAILVLVKGEDLPRTDLLAIDVAASHGKPVIWMIDKMNIHLDSLKNTGSFLAISSEFSCEDYLFNKGLRLNPDLIMDLQNSRIPQVVGGEDANSRTALFPFPYHPVNLPNSESNYLAKTNQPMAFYFVSSIDTLAFPNTVKKEILLRSSQYSRKALAPVTVDFSTSQVAPDPINYNQGLNPIAARINGKVSAYFKNRMLNTDIEFLESLGFTYNGNDYLTDQALISDVDFILPARDQRGRYFPIGFNYFEQFLYEGNTKFLNNVLESQILGNELLLLERGESAIRVLDGPKYQKRARIYFFISVVLPLAVLVFIYWLINWLRKIKYGS